MVESAKKWFETQQNQIQNNSPLARGISQTPLSKNVKWASARSYRHIGKDVVEVDVELTKNGKQIALNISKSENVEKKNFYTGIARLVMYKQRDGISFNTYLMVAVGKESYYAKHPNRMALNQQNAWDNDFSGWVLFFDWNENFVNGYELEEGRITLVSQKAKTNSLARTESYPPQDGCHQVWVHLGWDCRWENPDDPGYTPPPIQNPPSLPPPNPSNPNPQPVSNPPVVARQLVCDEIGYWYTECWTIPPPNNGGSGGSGAGGTNPPPSTPPPYVPPLYPTPDMDCQGCYETFMNNSQEVCEIICGLDYGMADVSPELTALTKNYGNLNPSEAQELDEALHTLIDNSPIFRVMYNFLLQKGVKIAWGRGANPGAGGGYNPNDKSIRLASFTSENLSEELFHAFQDAFYGGTVLKDIANHPQKVGRSNIEFEAQLFLDIVKRTQEHYRPDVGIGKDYVSMFGGRESYAFSLVMEEHEEKFEQYKDYLDSVLLRTYGISEILVTPRTMNDLGNVKYFEMLEIYRQAHVNDSYGSPSIPNFQPNAMLSLFNLASPFNYRQTSK